MCDTCFLVNMYLTGRKMHFFSGPWGKTTFKVLPKRTCFRSAVWWGFWNPEIFFMPTIPQKILLRNWHTQKLARLEGDTVPIMLRYPSQILCFRIAPYLHKKSVLRHPSKSRQVLHGLFHRVFCVQKPWLIILSRDNILSVTEIRRHQYNEI